MNEVKIRVLNENDLIKIKAKSKMSDFKIHSGYNLPSIKEKLKNFTISYSFNINQRVWTAVEFPNYPKGEQLAKLEDVYCKIFRIPITSTINEIQMR